MSGGTSPLVRVAAAVVRRKGAFLICRRPMHKRHGGLWEFPGGKVRPGESIQEAAGRELREELAMEMVEGGEVLYAVRDPGAPFLIEFLEVTALGRPSASEHDQISWRTPRELVDMDLAPADAAFVRCKLSGRQLENGAPAPNRETDVE